ncbi:MAG: Asp-tRNA(Asn)/Glu-tRNA(Gln) amidotransferase subunit GatC [Spirochaetales bacterium]
MDIQELETTAALAQIELGQGDLQKLGDAVSQMLDNFRKMNELDTTGLEPTTHALVKDNRVRPDSVEPSHLADALVERSPELEDRFLVIPNVL